MLARRSDLFIWRSPGPKPRMLRGKIFRPPEWAPVNKGGDIEPPVLTAPTFLFNVNDLDFVQNVPATYNYAQHFNRGNPAGTFTLQAGTLPSGMALLSNGRLEGTPDTVENLTGIVIRCTNSEGFADSDAHTIDVASGAVAPAWVGPEPADETFDIGPAMTPIDWGALFSGTNPRTYSAVGMPAGVSIVNPNGIMQGTPTETGVFNPVVTATNSEGSADSPGGYTLTVNGLAPTLLFPVNDLDYVQNVPVSYDFTQHFDEGTGAATYSLQAGTLPDGLSLSAAGQLTGTPTTVENQTGIVVRCTNAWGFADTDAFEIDIAAQVIAPTFTGPDPGDQSDEQNVPVTPLDYSPLFSGSNPRTYALAPTSGNLPTGLTLDSGAGVIFGSGTIVGVFPNIVVRCTNAAGFADAPAITWTITAPAPSVGVEYVSFSGTTVETDSDITDFGGATINI